MAALHAAGDGTAAGPAQGTHLDHARSQSVGWGQDERHGCSASSVTQLAQNSRLGQPANSRSVGAHRLVRYVAAALPVAMPCVGCQADDPGAGTMTRSDQVGQNVQVEVERTGGFGGLVTRRSADTDSLPAQEARQLAELVAALDLEALRNAPSPTRTVPDAFQYDIVISTGGNQVHLHAEDPDVPAQLRPLIRFVVQRT
jgi:hypothetical protein